MPLRALIFLTAINALNYLDRYLMAAVLPAVTAQFSLSQKEAGLLMSAFVPGYILFAPIFGHLGDRLHRPRLMALGVMLWSLATLLSALAWNFEIMVVSRVLVGIGEASFVSMAPGYIKDRTQDAVKLNTALSLFYCATPVGSALGFVLGGAMAERVSWHSAFMAGSIPGFICALLLLRYKEVSHRKPPQQSLIEGLRLITRVELLWFAVIGYVLNAFALNGVAAFVSSYGQSLGFTLEKIGTYFGIVLVIAGMLGTYAGGRLASHLTSQSPFKLATLFRFSGITSIIGAPFLLAAFLGSSQILFLVLCFAAEILIFASVAPINSIIVLACPAAFVTLTQGFTILMINLFGALPAPVAVGAMADLFSLRMGLCILSPVLLLSGLVWTLGGRRSKHITQ